MQRAKSILFIFFIMQTVWSSAQISSGGAPMLLPSLKSGLLEERMVKMSYQEVKVIHTQPEEFHKGKSVKFAHPFDVSLNPENSGIWSNLDDVKVWQLKIKSETAESIGLIFSKYKVPEGAQLFIYDEGRENIYGAFTSKNNKSFEKLAIYPFPGDELIIQYEEPLNAEFCGELEIGRVNHDYIGILKNRWKRRPSGDCNIDVNCQTNMDIANTQRAVMRIIADDELGTATLMNNTSEDGTPLALSAFHTFDNVDNAEITLFDFNYESPYCTGIDGYDLQTISGSTALAAFDSLDFILVEMSEMPPVAYRPYYAGWDALGDAPSETYTIHHPNGDVKKISNDEGICETMHFGSSFVKNGHWKVLNWEQGTTEGGSSGAGLFTKAGNVVGTLSGGLATCSNLSYDAFARLDLMWDYRQETSKNVKNWLDPNGTGVKQLNGMELYDAESVSCMMLSNYTIEDELQLVNNFVEFKTTSEIAERFSATNKALLSAFTVGVHDYTSNNPDSKLTIKIYKGEEEPETLLKEYSYSYSSLTKDAMNYIELPEVIEVMGTFFIALEPATEEDEITFYQSNFRGDKESTLMVYDGDWNSIEKYSDEGTGASLLLQVSACDITFNGKNDTILDEEILTRFYPNPASDFISVEFYSDERDYEIEIYDLVGKKVFSACYEQLNQTNIHISYLIPGIYLFVSRSDEISSTKRLVVVD